MAATQVPAPEPPAIPSAATPGAWATAAWEALRHFDQPPEHLAELAVAELGPRAAVWVGWLRETYPDASATGIARLAAQQAARLGWAITALGTGGPLTAPVSFSAVAWVRATLVLRIAAAHGYDPTDPRRARELIELLRLDPDAADSSAGLRWVGFAANVFTRLRRRRRVPVEAAVRLVLAAGEQSDSLNRLAHRAVRRYRR